VAMALVVVGLQHAQVALVVQVTVKLVTGHKEIKWHTLQK